MISSMWSHKPSANHKWSDQCEAINILLQITNAIQCYDTMHGCVSHINLINYYFGIHNDSINMQQFVYSFNKVCVYLSFHYGPLLSIQEVHYYWYVPVQLNIQLFGLLGVVNETVMLIFSALKMRDYHPLQQNIENEWVSSFTAEHWESLSEYAPLEQCINNEWLSSYTAEHWGWVSVILYSRALRMSIIHYSRALRMSIILYDKA